MVEKKRYGRKIFVSAALSVILCMCMAVSVFAYGGTQVIIMGPTYAGSNANMIMGPMEHGPDNWLISAPRAMKAYVIIQHTDAGGGNYGPFVPGRPTEPVGFWLDVNAAKGYEIMEYTTVLQVDLLQGMNILQVSARKFTNPDSTYTIRIIPY